MRIGRRNSSRPSPRERAPSPNGPARGERSGRLHGPRGGDAEHGAGRGDVSGFLVLGLSPETVMATLNRPEAGAARLDQGELPACDEAGGASRRTPLHIWIRARCLSGCTGSSVHSSRCRWHLARRPGSTWMPGNSRPRTSSSATSGRAHFPREQVENGVLVESAGTLTLNQAVLGTAVGIGVAALPAIQQMSEGRRDSCHRDCLRPARRLCRRRAPVSPRPLRNRRPAPRRQNPLRPFPLRRAPLEGE